uniref:RRM domain-containing protein n=1 Tax=Heterorhabditis bacteriophora TaxID=37862 RepID=A0A1I7WSI3_HETBA
MLFTICLYDDHCRRRAIKREDGLLTRNGTGKTIAIQYGPFDTAKEFFQTAYDYYSTSVYGPSLDI